MTLGELRMERKVCSRIPTKDGSFLVYLYHSSRDPTKEHMAFVYGDLKNGEVRPLIFFLDSLDFISFSISFFFYPIKSHRLLLFLLFFLFFLFFFFFLIFFLFLFLFLFFF